TRCLLLGPGKSERRLPAYSSGLTSVIYEPSRPRCTIASVSQEAPHGRQHFIDSRTVQRVAPLSARPTKNSGGSLDRDRQRSGGDGKCQRGRHAVALPANVWSRRADHRSFQSIRRLLGSDFLYGCTYTFR